MIEPLLIGQKSRDQQRNTDERDRDLDNHVGARTLRKSHEVTSSCLCKKSEGAGFPFQVKAMEDGINYSIDTLDVYKANHWSGSAPHFDKTTLNDIGSPQLLPQMLWEAEKRQ